MRHPKKLRSIAILAIPFVLLSLAITAQETSGGQPQQSSDTTSTLPAPNPAPKPKPKKKEGKHKQKQQTASGPPSALCRDGTMSHEKPQQTGGKQGNTLCKQHGGVSHYF
jgi:hypothetical protein